VLQMLARDPRLLAFSFDSDDVIIQSPVLSPTFCDKPGSDDEAGKAMPKNPGLLILIGG